MNSIWDIVGRLIGIGVPSFIVLDVFFLMPKRMRKLEGSNDQRDIKRLRRMKWALDVMKLRWMAGFLLVLVLVSLCVDFFSMIFWTSN